MPVSTYLVDTFLIYAASATAANTVLRSLLGALLPLAGGKMCKSMVCMNQYQIAYVQRRRETWIRLGQFPACILRFGYDTTSIHLYQVRRAHQDQVQGPAIKGQFNLCIVRFQESHPDNRNGK